MNYGALPTDLGLIDIAPSEMMFWMYCPVAIPYGILTVPPTLTQFLPIIGAAMEDGDFYEDRYDLVGNSINHDLPESHWPLIARQDARNHPQSRLA